MSFKDVNTRIRAIQLKEEGNGPVTISTLLGIPQQTVSDFLNKKTFKSWWDTFDGVISGKLSSEDGPKVLVIDIETAPILAQVWRCWKENIGFNQIKEDWYILSWAAKWYGSPDSETIYMDCRKEGLNDYNLMVALWKLLDEADWVITQNGDKFDIPKIRARMVLLGLSPFSPVQQIDTKKIACKEFGFTRNSLEYLSSVFCPDHAKLKHKKFPGFELWKECIQGNEEAWEEMRLYNIQDVVSLERVYNSMMSWATTHPNFALYTVSDEMQCPKCGSTHLKQSGFAYTSISKFERYQCQSCHSWSRARTNVLSKDKKQNILTGVK